MKFGPQPLAKAEGAYLAHSIRLPAGMLRKGARLAAADIAALRDAGHGEVRVAILEDGDVHEDVAAQRLAEAVAGPGVRVEQAFTGRSNLYAEAGGVLRIDRMVIDRLNRLSSAITIATLPEFATVEAGRMVGTVKIIPFAAPQAALGEAEAIARAGRPLEVRAFRPLRVGLIATELPSLKPSVMDKTRRILEERLAKAGATLIDEKRVAHQAEAVGKALAAEMAEGRDLLIVFGASAVVDESDVIPAGIHLAGGTVRHVGMPVDPGNLLILAELGGIPVLGAPGCARSPVENGFDWVLDRLLAGIEVTPDDVTGMGVGGLLMEIVSRPQPRAGRVAPVAALILAAGKSSRMGGPNKLLATIGDRKIIRIVAEAALASGASPVIVVTGHMAVDVGEALQGLDVRLVHNPAFGEGMSTSLRAGIGAVPADSGGALILLGDMPGLDEGALGKVVAAHQAGGIVVATSGGRRGNPVLWDRRYFDELREVTGDKGARDIIAAHKDAVIEVELGPAAALDLDTPEALSAAGGRF